MSAFQLINSSSGNVTFKSGAFLAPGQSRYVETIDLEMARFQARGLLVIKDVGPIFGEEDLIPDYDGVKPLFGGDNSGGGGTITGSQLAALIASDPAVQSAIMALATTTIADLNNTPLGRAFPL